jgi:AcrR family transcriptional regulator
VVSKRAGKSHNSENSDFPAIEQISDDLSHGSGGPSRLLPRGGGRTRISSLHMGGEAGNSEREDETRRRILNGALHAIGQVGISRLSMRSIADAAGVSRGTVYRYFENKEEVLLAVSLFDQRRYNHGVRRSVDQATPGIDQLRAHLKYSFGFLANHPSRWMVEHEPLFLMGYLTEQLPAMGKALEKSLRDVLKETSAVRSGRLKTNELADLIVRILVSAYLLPGENPEAPLDAIANLITDDIELTGPKRRVQPPRKRKPSRQ